MKVGDICKTSGEYWCLYHLKRKIKVKKGESFPRCDFASLNCEGYWAMKKETREITLEEKMKAHIRRIRAQDKARNRNNDYEYKEWVEGKRKPWEW